MEDPPCWGTHSIPDYSLTFFFRGKNFGYNETTQYESEGSNIMSPTPKTYVEETQSDRRRKILSYAAAGVAGGLTVLYITKYNRTFTHFCHITPEQLEHLKTDVSNCVRYDLSPTRRVMVTMAPNPNV